MLVAVLLSSLSLGLAQPPSIGVACIGQANVTTCGRIGIAVWLKRPAQAVTVRLAGFPIRLHQGGFGGVGPTYWEGYIHLPETVLRLPTHWEGANPTRWLVLRLHIRYASGSASGSQRLLLRAGWG